jgi:nicotinamide-nucleotide amidase
LTEGKTLDRHGQYLSTFFTELGFSVRRIAIIPDDEPLYKKTLLELIQDSSVVVTTGGLGPTSDDLTREVVAEVAGVGLEFNDHVWQSIVDRFKPRIVPETNKKQALIPAGFELFLNPNGTAPGFAGNINDCHVAALPGPPRELHPMCEQSLRRYLERSFSLDLSSRILATALLISESALEESLQKHRRPGIEWGTRAEEFRISFTIRGGSDADQEAVLSDLQRDLGAFHIRRGEISPERILIDSLREGGMRLVTAESCTGGLVGKLLTDVPGASQAYWGGFVTYDNTAKSSILGVPEEILEAHGAVSKQTVIAMAQGALEAAGEGVELAVAVSGVAGPSGGTPEKPVGTVWIGIAGSDGRREAHDLSLGSTRDLIRRRAAVGALLLGHAFINSENFEA